MKAAPDLKGKIVLITGSTKGIGLETAKVLAGQHATLILNYHSDDTQAQKAKGVIDHITRKPTTLIKADISDPKQVEKLVAEVIKKHKRIDCLINNAGSVSQPADWQNITPSAWDSTLAVNLTGAFNLIKLVAPYMVKNKYGRIINISSTLGLQPSAHAIAYSVAKAGLISITKAMSREVSPHVTINCIAPGWTDTDWHSQKPASFFDQVKKIIPLKRLATKHEVASLISYLISDNASYITGQTLALDGGYLATTK